MHIIWHRHEEPFMCIMTCTLRRKSILPTELKTSAVGALQTTDEIEANIWPPVCPTQCAAGDSTGSRLKLSWTKNKSVTTLCPTYRSNVEEERINQLFEGKIDKIKTENQH